MRTDGGTGLAWAVAALAFALHNGEELLLDLPGWARGQPDWGWMAMLMPEERFRAAVIGLTILVLTLAIVAARRPARWNRILLLVFAWIMLANAASHVGLSFLTTTLMPGVVSAVLLVAPVMVWVVVTQSRRRQ